MKTLTLLTAIILTVCTATLLQAKPVSLQKAQQIATIFYKHINPASAIDNKIVGITEGRHDDLLTFYTFQFQSGGFVIVAADDASIPILGYSAQGTIQDESMSPATRDWLDDYSKQIYEIVKARLSNRKTLLKWKAILAEDFPKPTKDRDIEPLLTTTWKQRCYYNELCPEDPEGPCGHVVTGCVATAMAQIMKYHNFPPQGVGIHSYLHPVYGEQTVDFGNTTYDWDAMPDEVTESNIPVATINYHAGVSVDMYYGPNSSGANPVITESMVNYFNYHPGIEAHYQADYEDLDEWKALLRADLDEQLPIYYQANSSETGHAFICDGYRMSDEKFHFNWGWGGNADGWFVIDWLNPGNIVFDESHKVVTQIKPYNTDLIVRLTQPLNNTLIEAGQTIDIKATTVRGTPAQMKITIDEEEVASGISDSLFYSWSTTEDDLGAHEIKAWSYNETDSVYSRINLNVSEWEPQASGFDTPLRNIHYIHAVDSNVLWASAMDVISFGMIPIQEFTRTVDGGETWTAGNIPDCEGLGISMIFGLSSTTAYIAMHRVSGYNPMGIYVTTDGGETWNRQASADFHSGYSFPNCVHFFNENDGWCMGDPVDGEFEIFNTTDGGETWVQVDGADIPNAMTEEVGIWGGYSAVDETIWFGTSMGRIYKSTDKGFTWSVRFVQPLAGNWLTPVFRNASHGLVHNFAYYPEFGKICETFDGGNTWTLVDYTGPMYWTDLAYLPNSENTWISTGGMINYSTGASFSFDGGHSWGNFPGTEGTRFSHIAWPTKNCGYAGSTNLNETEGGMYKFVGESIITDDPKHQVNNESGIHIYPNPFTTSTTIEYELQQPSTVQITIYNHLGKQLAAFALGQMELGKHTFSWQPRNLPAGVYYGVLRTDNKTKTTKIIKLK